MTNDFWLRLVEAFTDAGLDHSQTAIARQVGVAQSAVAKWANGSGYPHLRKCLRIAEMTGVSADWLLTGRGNKKQGEGHMDESTQTLLAQWAELPASTKREVLEFVRWKAAQTAEPHVVRPDHGINRK
jgi:transcriptional regulator with XRE-family HTH domain